jgi:hypothetical protein
MTPFLPPQFVRHPHASYPHPPRHLASPHQGWVPPQGGGFPGPMIPPAARPPVNNVGGTEYDFSEEAQAHWLEKKKGMEKWTKKLPKSASFRPPESVIQGVDPYTHHTTSPSTAAPPRRVPTPVDYRHKAEKKRYPDSHHHHRQQQSRDPYIRPASASANPFRPSHSHPRDDGSPPSRSHHHHYPRPASALDVRPVVEFRPVKVDVLDLKPRPNVLLKKSLKHQPKYIDLRGRSIPSHSETRFVPLWRP